MFTKHEEGEVDDPEHGPELRGGGALGAGLDGVEGGLQGGAQTHRELEQQERDYRADKEGFRGARV